LIPHLPHIHTHSIRLASGDEALVTRVVAEGGRIGYGFSAKLDATESRHMAEINAGLRNGMKIELPAELKGLAETIRWEDK